MTTDPSSAAVLAQRSPRLFRLFALYLRWYTSRSFHAVRLSRSFQPSVPPNQPLIVYSNHASWWDPAIYILLCDILFRGRPSYGPMDQAALAKYGIFKKMGIFGVDLADPRAGAAFLRISQAVLGTPGAMLWLTPEGEFTDNRLRPVRFRPGLAHVARRVPGAMILPMALDYCFWNESRPEALVRFGQPMISGGDGTVAEWNQRLEAALTQTMDALTAEAATRNPALFQPLIRGGAGVGGIYDLYRRARALAAGRRFDPSHEGETL